MTFTCAWCELAGLPSTKPGDPSAYEEGTGKPLCKDCADEQDGAIDAANPTPTRTANKEV